MPTLVPGGRFEQGEELFQYAHKYKLWQAYNNFTGMPPHFKWASIYYQRKAILLKVAEALQIQVPPHAKNKEIVACLDNHIFTTN